MTAPAQLRGRSRYQRRGARQTDLASVSTVVGRNSVVGGDVKTYRSPMPWHTADEFLGLTEVEARAWAGALGWAYRDLTHPVWVNDDLRYDRINVSFGSDGRVDAAHIG